MPFTERLAAALQASLAGGNFALALGAAFLGGLLTAFTGCVYPLIPITVRYFGAMRGATRLYVVLRAAVYVGGMVLLYATLGTVFASLQLVLGGALASPYVIAVIATLCFAMGLSMLGVFTLQLPTDLNTRLTRVGGNGVGGAFLMGLVSGVIAAPCTGPVLAVILSLIATRHSVSFGFALMVCFGLGMGLPFLVLALFWGALARLSAARGLFSVVKVVLASVMFVVSGYFLRIAWPGFGAFVARLSLSTYLNFALLALGIAATLAYQRWRLRAGADALKIAATVLLSVAGILVIVGSRATPTNVAPLAATSTPTPASTPISSPTQTLTPTPAGTGTGATTGKSIGPGGRPPPVGDGLVWETSEEVGVARAKAAHRPVMIDFGAEWCEACKELERKTYPDARVRTQAQRFVSIKIDATNIDEKVQKLLDRYGVMGLPTVVFIDSTGRVLTSPRVLGFVTAERMATVMQQVH